MEHWLRKLEKYSEDEVSSGLVINPPEISPKFTERLTTTLREAYAYGYWLNHLYVQELKNAQSGRSYKGKLKLSEMPPDEELSRLLREFIRFDESEEWQEIIPQEAIEWLGNYVPQLAGSLSNSVLERVNEVIRKSMLDGKTLKERKKDLREVSVELSRMSEARIESIARTEITRADTMGRLTSMKSNPDVIGIEFSAILDDRTTEICSSRHGLVMTLDDPRLPENTPPCHVNCRSMLLSCTIYDYPDGLLTSHEFDEVPSGMQRSEDISEVQKILETDYVSFSGAISGALNDSNDPYREQRDAHAERYYEELRNRRDREAIVRKLSEHSGIPIKSARKVYLHVFINKYDLDGEIKRFDSYDKEWLDYVAQCREGIDSSNYDMIIGGIANDRVIITLDRYFSGEISQEEALGLLRFEKPNIQYCIRTNRMLQECLKYMGSEQL